jgi:hypothetical protein
MAFDFSGMPIGLLRIRLSEVATCCLSVAASAGHYEKSGNKAATNMQLVAALWPLQNLSNIFFEVLRLELEGTNSRFSI